MSKVTDKALKNTMEANGVEPSTSSEETAIVTAEPNQVAEYSGASRGLENADMGNLSLPRIIVMQPTSPALTEEGSTLRMGDLVNTLTLEKLPSSRFIPLLVWDSNILFTPRAERPEDTARLIALGFTDDDFQQGNILCNAKDGKHGDRRGDCHRCGLNAFHGNVKPICNATVNVLAQFDGVDLPVIIQFSVTSKKHGDKFKQMLLFAGGDIFRKAYKLTAMRKTAAGNKVWYEIVATPAGNVTEEEFISSEAMHTAMKASQESWRNNTPYEQEAPSQQDFSSKEY